MLRHQYFLVEVLYLSVVVNLVKLLLLVSQVDKSLPLHLFLLLVVNIALIVQKGVTLAFFKLI